MTTPPDLRRAAPAPEPLRAAARPALPRPTCGATCRASRAERPLLVLMHGWMDVGASFQFVVDAMRRRPRASSRPTGAASAAPACRRAPTATGSPTTSATSTRCSTRCRPTQPVDLLGHSMGGNVVMSYAGVRPERVRRLINLEGFGMPARSRRPGAQAPGAVARRAEGRRSRLRTYASLAEVVARGWSRTTRAWPDKRAAWLAAHWAERRADGQWHVLGDPAHKRVNPMLYRKDEVLEGWKRIAAPTLWVEGDETDPTAGGATAIRAASSRRASRWCPTLQRTTLADCGHMLHFDQPEALAARLVESCAVAPSDPCRAVGGTLEPCQWIVHQTRTRSRLHTAATMASVETPTSTGCQGGRSSSRQVTRAGTVWHPGPLPEGKPYRDGGALQAPEQSWQGGASDVVERRSSGHVDSNLPQRTGSLSRVVPNPPQAPTTCETMDASLSGDAP